MNQSPITSTTPEALRAAIANAVQVDAQQLKAAVGSIAMATSDAVQASDPQIQSLYDSDSRTLKLLVDRIPVGKEVPAFGAALIQHLGHRIASELVGQSGSLLVQEAQAHPHSERDAVSQPSVFLLAEYSWGDDAYGEDVPVAGLYRVTASTLQKLDHIAGLLESKVLSSAGASVNLPDADVALLSVVAFTSENTLAPVPGFFDPEKDRVLYLSDAANMTMDGDRVDYRPACEVFVPDMPEHDDFVGMSFSASSDLGVTSLAAHGQAGQWRLSGFLESWPKLREQIAAELERQKIAGVPVRLGSEQQPFDPRMQFDSPAHAATLISQQTSPRAAMLSVIAANLDHGEFAFVAELVTAYGAMEYDAHAGRDLEMPNMIEVLGDRKLTHSIFRNQIKLGGKDQPTPEQEKLVARLNTVVGEAAQLAFDAGLAQIHRQLGVERGAAMPVADAEAGKQLGAIFGAYLIDEVEAAMEQAQHVARKSDSPAP